MIGTSEWRKQIASKMNDLDLNYIREEDGKLHYVKSISKENIHKEGKRKYYR